MACAIRGNNDIKGIKLPGESDGKELEAKISMFADDTQLFNKDERSVEKSFDILSKYEKASGSRINYNKTKANMEKNFETNPFVFMDVVAFLTNI
jgi:hypothetical protein